MTVQGRWALLPNELFRRVLFCVDIFTALRCFATCRRLYTFLIADNQLWRQLYMRTFSRHLATEAEWLTIYRQYWQQEKDVLSANHKLITASSAIQWRIATEHRKQTELNWHHKRYVEYQHKIELVDSAYPSNIYVITGPAGALLFHFTSRRILFLDTTKCDQLVPLFTSAEKDETIPFATISNLRVIIGVEYITVVCGDPNTLATQLFVWRVGSQTPHIVEYVSPQLQIKQICNHWLLTWKKTQPVVGGPDHEIDYYQHCTPDMPMNDMDTASDFKQFEIVVINLETNHVTYRFCHMASICVNIQDMNDGYLRLLRGRKLPPTEPPTEQIYWQWELWQYNGKSTQSCCAQGTVELPKEFDKFVCSRQLTATRVLLSRYPYPVGDDDTYAVLQIDLDKKGMGTGSLLWTVSARNYDLPLLPLNRLLTYARYEECCLLDIDTGEVKETYFIGLIECVDHAIGSWCVAHIDDTLCLVDASTGEKSVLVEGMYDQRGYWGASKGCVYYWHRETYELRVLDFTSFSK
ncbi:hypothetical protein BDF19DRAFT_446303 [Syncephalis fuscata]|nr:hypothetical protein BDF19DRAFT_446303 [Syncephalis fuscata]